MMKKLLLAILALILINGATLLSAQDCTQPQDVVAYINQGTNSGSISWLTTESDCSFLYFEVEYSNAAFTPGQEEGTLVSAIEENSFVLPDSENSFAWVRSVCDCEPEEGDGEADTASEWVEAFVYQITPPPAADPGLTCSAGPMAPVNLPHLCGEGLSTLKFLAPYASQGMSTFSCSSGPVHRIWRNFIAPDSETVSIEMYPSPQDFGDWQQEHHSYGMAIYVLSCNGPLFECIPSFTSSDMVIVDDLIPCMQYFVAFWNNGFNYSSNAMGVFNGTANELNICDVDLTTGIENNIEQAFSVFPNPSNGFFNVHVFDPNYASIQVFDLNGKLVNQQNQVSEFNQIDLSNLPKGTYFMQVTTTNNTSIERISIQ